jgi:hypothetical protein
MTWLPDRLISGELGPPDLAHRVWQDEVQAGLQHRGGCAETLIHRALIEIDQHQAGQAPGDQHQSGGRRRDRRADEGECPAA